MEREEEIKLQESLPVLGTVGSMVSQEEGWVAYIPVINCGVKPTGLLVGCKLPIFVTTIQ